MFTVAILQRPPSIRPFPCTMFSIMQASDARPASDSAVSDATLDDTGTNDFEPALLDVLGRTQSESATNPVCYQTHLFNPYF